MVKKDPDRWVEGNRFMQKLQFTKAKLQMWGKKHIWRDDGEKCIYS